MNLVVDEQTGLSTVSVVTKNCFVFQGVESLDSIP